MQKSRAKLLPHKERFIAEKAESRGPQDCQCWSHRASRGSAGVRGRDDKHAAHFRRVCHHGPSHQPSRRPERPACDQLAWPLATPIPLPSAPSAMNRSFSLNSAAIRAHSLRCTSGRVCSAPLRSLRERFSLQPPAYAAFTRIPRHAWPIALVGARSGAGVPDSD